MNNGKICISVCAGTADEMIANIKRADEFADVVEVRFDCLDASQIEVVRTATSNLNFQKPLLATFRSPEQGGNGNASSDERLAFWRSGFDGLWASDLEEDVIEASAGRQNRIVSFHDFNGVPDDLDDIFDRMSGSDAEIIKLAVTAADVVDAIPVWNLIKRARTAGKQIIPIAMGEAGKWTRILGLSHGAFLTYASLDAGKETAGGQLTAKDLLEVYRVKVLTEETKAFAVIGDPVSQSLSPYMHNSALAATGENAVFIHLLVRNLDEFMRRMVKPATREVELNFGGFSVTMPHKQAIIKHLDAIDPTAKKIGAVNTVSIKGGKLTGYNTDAHGFITPLKARFGDLRGSRIAILGGGGAARACIHALKNEGADITVFVRDRAKAATFSNEMAVTVKQLPLFSADTDNLRVNRFDVLVNATPIGMPGALESESLFTAEELLGVKFVYDLVTRLADTPLIAEARKAGIPTIGGVEMLIGQGAKQFEIWTGRKAPVELMRASLLARMKG